MGKNNPEVSVEIMLFFMVWAFVATIILLGTINKINTLNTNLEYTKSHPPICTNQPAYEYTNYEVTCADYSDWDGKCNPWEICKASKSGDTFTRVCVKILTMDELRILHNEKNQDEINYWNKCYAKINAKNTEINSLNTKLNACSILNDSNCKNPKVVCDVG